MSMASPISPLVQKLLTRGVRIPSPFSVEIDESVHAEQIAPGVILHTGCKISGSRTSIGPGSELGRETPATVEDCQLGHNVELNGGYFSGATFLDGVHIGSGAHVRPGTLLEEESGCAHTVGLKQTIFLPFVTAGSLINFCDALMAGGTSRTDHSEIGSSYIHFNFTPHQDKATPSLVGDVPRGVFLDQPPIFLGGQGGLAGPVRIAYGTVIPAGTICRQDILEECRLFAPADATLEGRPFQAGAYKGIQRIVKNNLIYIGNLSALKAWYQYIRTRTMAADEFSRACHAGALRQLDEGIKERVKRLRDLAGKMPSSLQHALADAGKELPSGIKAQQQALIDRWPEIEFRLQAGCATGIGAAHRDAFLKEWERTPMESGHIQAIRSLNPQGRKAGTAWLQEIVNSAAALWTDI
jgi:hypothetical protein